MSGRPAAGHPYSKLLEELDGAWYVKWDRERGRVLAWHGGKRVQVLNTEGALSDFFTIGIPEPTTALVAEAIGRWLEDDSDN